MGKIFTSLRLLMLLAVLTSAASSYWYTPSTGLVEYPKKQVDLPLSWYDSPFGIFSTDLYKGSEAAGVNAPADQSQSTDLDSCYASINIPDATYTGTELSWAMTGATTGTGTGQVGTHSFGKGTTIITYTVKDADGNTSHDSTEITVTDDQNPYLSTGSPVSQTTDPTQCTASISIPSVSFGDNCEGATLSWTMTGASSASGSGQVGSKIFNLGTTTISYTVTDAANNIISGELSVTVTDAEDPSITAPSDLTVNVNSGSCFATGVALGNPATGDNCEVDQISHNAPSSFPVGETIVTWTVKDKSGNSATAIQTVTVVDNEKPVISASTDISTTSDNGSCGAAVNITPASASDNCTVGTPTGTRDDGQSLTATYPVGTTTITWTVADEHGNEADPVTQTVTVTDNEKPVISAGADITTTSDPGVCGASVNVPAATAADNCTAAAPTGTRDDGQSLTAIYPVGTTTITWTVADEHGNEADPVIQTVTVADNEKPVISAGADITTTSDPGVCGASVNVPAATATDNCTAGAPTGTRDDGQSLTAIYPVGTTTITWTVADEHGNKADPVTQTVTVTDNEKPVISAGADITTTSDTGVCGASVNVPAATAADNCTAAAPTGTRDDGQSLTATYPVGTTTITWTVTDEHGNKADPVTQTVTVADNEKPVIYAGADITTTSDPGVCGASVNVPAATATDNCTAGAPSATRDDGKNLTATYPVGTTTITWTVTDEHGNKADPVTQTVTVTDNEKPVITAGADITLSNEAGLCYASTSEITASASDNCSVGSPQGVRDDGQPLNASYPVGTTIITWTVKDSYGNEAAPVEQRVTVEDTEAPTPPVLEDVTSGCTYTFDIPSAVDNCTANVTVTHDKPLTFSSTGTITWTFTDAAGNSSTAQQTVTIDPIVTIVADKIDVLCNGHATGEIRVTATGGVPPYTFDWGSIGAGNTKTDLPAGTYSVTAKDSNGCQTAPLEVTIEEPATFVEIKSVKTTTGCYQQNNGTATVEATGGTGGYTYLWDNGQTTQTATDLAPGSYSVQVTDENGCTATKSFTVSPPAELKITGFLTTETTSYGSATGTATVQVSGGTPSYTFSWSDQNKQTGQTASGLPAGTYIVTVTDANGCSTSGEVTILDSLEAVIVPTSICEGEEEIVRTSYFEVEDLTAKGGTPDYTYEWSFGEDSFPATATGPGPHRVKYSVIGDKLITLKVTDSQGLTLEKQIIQYVGGCFSNDCGSNDLQADNYFVGDAFGNKITSTNCAESGQKYLYIVFPTQSERYSLNIEYIYSIENLSTGEITNAREAGCYYEHQAIPLIAQTIPIDYNCGDLIKIEGIYLTFSNNSKWACGQGPNPKCYSTNNETSVTTPLYGVAFPSTLLCNGGSNGSVSTRASGGSGTYRYKLISSPEANEIRGFQDSSTFTGLEAGKYRVIISDGVQEYTTAEVEILQPDNPLRLDLVSQTEITCFQGSDGTATVEASGGTPNSTGDPYIYVWEDLGQTTATATNLSAGTYRVRVLDANGCEAFTEVIIDDPDEIPAVAGPDQVLPCGNLETFLQAEIGSPAGEEETELIGTWSIVNGPAGGVIEDIHNPNSRFTGTTGTYTLRWTVPCGATDDVKISFGNCSTLDFDGIDDHVVIGDKFDLPGTFTIEGWIKQDAGATSGIRTIFSERDNASPGSGGFALIVEDNVPKFQWNGGEVISGYPIGTDRWYHIAVILGGEHPGLYVDGIKVSDGIPAQPTATSNPFIIGASYNSSTPLTPEHYFHGWIEEVRIWKTALTKEQLHFLMNQRLEVGTNPLRGTALPIPAPGPLSYNEHLIAYYQLIVSEITNGVTTDKGPNAYHGKMVNIQTLQQNTAPLPYISAKNGAWIADDTWLRPAVWDHPNSKGIDGSTFIDWNIVIAKHNITSQNKDITVLGLRHEAGKLTISNPSGPQNETNSGQMLRVTHYLKLDGFIDLFGESQLIQDEGSILDSASKGKLERDQQGTASSYNYNYWTSPVSLSAGNTPFAIASVMKDGTTTSPQNLDFGPQYHYADGGFTNPRRVSNYWLFKFHGTANDYGKWFHVGSTGSLKVGEGYSMKGTSGYASNADLQNYTFTGMPNNGTIELNINKTSEGENYLIGNPYPSALDAVQFINDNIVSGDISQSAFNGTLYFWDHFAKTSHYLQQYIGGYAVYNLSGSIEPASSVDSRIDNSDPTKTGSKRPGDFIPVGQGFFVNTMVHTTDENVTTTGGNLVRFRNEQRVYKREGIDKTESGRDVSVFHAPERKGDKRKASETRRRIWFKYRSPMGYHRQILVTEDQNTSTDFDLGYDAPLMDNNLEDMFWLINQSEFVIQGVPDFGKERVLPLGIKVNKGGIIKIEIDETENIPENFLILLKDNLTNVYHDLRLSAFETELEAGTLKDRFSIVFYKESEQTEENPEDEENEDEDGNDEDEQGDGNGNQGEKPEEGKVIPGEVDVFYLYKAGQMVIKNPKKLTISKGTLYNGLGQKISEFRNIPADVQVELPVQLNTKGLYIFHLEYESGGKSVKFIVE